MSDEHAQSEEPLSEPMPSTSSDPAEALLRMRALDPPVRPGLVANLDRFEILRLLGVGGMGVVLLARDPQRSAQVAIKLLKPELASEPRAVHRFLVEARHMEHLSHPNVLKVLEVSERPDGPYFVLPYLDRGSLAKLIRADKPLDYHATLRIAQDVAAALTYAHAQGIIHRDLKPDNVLVDGEGRAYLADFGLVRTVYNDSTWDLGRGQCVGTGPYMSPGVAAGQAEDTRCDIYSFGAMLYEMLTGKPPYEGQTLEEVRTRIGAAPPPPIAQCNPKAPAGLVQVAQWAMARELRDRYAQMADVLADLQRLEKGLPPVGPHGQGGPRRHARRITAAVAIGLALLLALLGIIVKVIKVTRRHEDRSDVAVSPEPAAPDIAGREWILLSWSEPGQGRSNLWLFSPDGKTRVRITENSQASDCEPKFSPDRRHLAFSRRPDNGRETIWVCDVDGKNARALIALRDQSEAFLSPVWISNSRLYCVRDPKYDQSPDGEIWQIDLHGEEPKLVCRIQEAFQQGLGCITDVAPNGRQMVMAASEGAWAPTLDIYIIDLKARPLHTIWQDEPRDWRDDRALWSYDGKCIAWRHVFTKGAHQDPEYYGVGMARLGNHGTWTTQLQPDRDTFVTPLAWSPLGEELLCARLQDENGATLFVMNEQFQVVRTLCELDTWDASYTTSCAGRMADWAIVPAGLLKQK